jgi:hypothetical protein
MTEDIIILTSVSIEDRVYGQSTAFRGGLDGLYLKIQRQEGCLVEEEEDLSIAEPEARKPQSGTALN